MPGHSLIGIINFDFVLTRCRVHAPCSRGFITYTIPDRIFMQTLALRSTDQVSAVLLWFTSRIGTFRADLRVTRVPSIIDNETILNLVSVI